MGINSSIYNSNSNSISNSKSNHNYGSCSNSSYNYDLPIITNSIPTINLSLWNYNLDTKTLSEDILKKNYIMIDTIITYMLKSEDKKTILDYLTNRYREYKYNKEYIMNDIIRSQVNVIFGLFIARLTLI